MVLDLEKEYELEKFMLYDAGNFEADTYNIDGYNIYVSTTAPDLSLISKTEDKNKVWTKVVDTKGRRGEKIKTDIITPLAGRYLKLEIPRSRTSNAVRLYQFEVYKKAGGSSTEQINNNLIEITPNVLKSGDNLTLKNCNSGRLKIYNLRGHLLIDKNISETETSIPLHIPAGMYVVELKSNTTVKTTKIIVM